MIGLLRGTIADKGSGWVLVDTGAVGFSVAVPTPFSERMGDLGGPVVMRTFLDVREGALDLYGFSDTDELEVFKALIGVSRIGPKIALKVLSTLTPTQIVQAVNRRDLELLCRVPGLGEETANRLVVDLARRIKKIRLSSAAAAQPADRPLIGELKQKVGQALKNLGYSREETEQSVRWAASSFDKTPTLEEFLKKALSYFREGR